MLAMMLTFELKQTLNVQPGNVAPEKPTFSTYSIILTAMSLFTAFNL